MAKKADSRRKSMKKSPIQKSKTSYLTRLIYWIENRNISSTYIYISIWMVLTLTQLVPQYAENNGIVMETLPVHLWLAAMPPLHMILIRYLDSNALKSVRNLRPVLKLKGKYLKDLEHNVLTLPRTTTFIFGFVVLILIIISEKINGVYQLEH